MTILDTLRLAFKGAGAGGRPRLARWFQSPWGAALTDDAPFSYDAAVRAGYERNPVAQRAVRLVAEGVGAAPVESDTPGLAALANASSGGQRLFETVAAQLLLHGNAFVQILRSPGGEAAELFALRPDRVTIVPDARGWPAAFQYRAGDAVETIDAIGTDGRPQIVHIKGYHPLDDHYGLGCLGAAAEAIGLHNAATRWNRALLDNGARPSGALVYDPGDGSTLSPEQFARLKAELESAYQGPGNSGRPMLLEGGLSWQSMAMSPADMDFAGLKEAAARDIALAFGVPPMLLGLPGDNSYANYREANKALWRLTLLPLATTICEALTEGLADWFPAAALTISVDHVPALSEDRERLWSSVTAADFLSREEKREMLGLTAKEAV